MSRSRSFRVFRRAMLVVVAYAVHVMSQTPRTGNPAAQHPGAQQPTTTTSKPGTVEAPTAASPTKSTLPVNDVEQMTRMQFRALPDNAVVRYRGQSVTKAAFVQQRLEQIQVQDRAQGAPPSFEALRNQFLQGQAAALETRNARVQAVGEAAKGRIARVESSPAYASLLKETAEIQRRYHSASPEEQLRLKQRALEIHTELLKLESD